MVEKKISSLISENEARVGRNVSRPLQYDQENWVSTVLIRNLKIKTHKERWQKKITLFNEEEN
jgi:hypothetical protein